ncbi:putative ABC transport system permease protein [Dysgonomonas alginatilytica]|uniref:Putative ABC transport system permease protein n=1 Tax=Dysgonomonas alginatilytica TaxID=1605892 RepID=A0A2V3PJW5_9BACT|nr:ABC transporter permease [Dysgonomonas alginatilytica]PXV58873.1 putative ABC transport system permease protein [Dysgonomonas alginatilytica]
MLKHYFKITVRSLIKDRRYSFINIVGLSVAIACCFLLIFWIKFELSFEDGYPKGNQIYRVMKVENRIDGLHKSAYIRPTVAEELKTTFPQIEAATFMSHENLPFVREDKSGEDGISIDYVTTNKDFLKMFSFVYLEGSPQNIVNNRGVLITKDAAYKFFGNESPIGKSITFGISLTCTIEAVVELPRNTQVRFDVLSIDGHNSGGTHYIMMKENAEVTPEFKRQIADFLSTQGETKDKLVLQPLKDIHLHSPKEVAINTRWEVYGNLEQIYLFSAAVILILIIAIINYINTSIARALSRMKEVGVRKVTGATKRQLKERFLFESFFISAISVIVALALVKFFFPVFSKIMGTQTAFSFDLQSALIAIAVCIIISLLSGGYAAFYLSSFSPKLVMRGGSNTGSKEGLRKALIGLQFFISISILMCTTIIYKQINAIFNADTGVNRENIIVLETSFWYDAENFIQIIKKENSNIIAASIAMSAPYNSSWGYSGISWEGSSDEVKNVEFTEISCDTHYANTFGLKVIEGEFIKPGLKWWQWTEDKSFDIVINESFKKMMGEANPIGITVTYGFGRQGKIIGVVKDFNFKPLREKISPLIISFNPETCFNVYVKTTGKDKQATLEYILGKYKEMKPGYAKRPVAYHTVDDEYKEMYAVELRTAHMLSVFSVISFVISLLGIISMVSFMVEKRTKEIAIRKINGASIKDISILFITGIAKVGLVASAISIPICYVIMYQWLEGFIYRTALSWWIFALIPLFMLLITALVIIVQIYYTARQSPVESLRSE